ncbi:catecholate siderophore receptor Fiu [Niveibacterium sp. SC-1]|uniref:catecholate siderophore receptor Fiu n=1 Tax=Niveibacterium sp. SC-1 TaxID=3135646 RepID=UPI00311DBDEA
MAYIKSRKRPLTSQPRLHAAAAALALAMPAAAQAQATKEQQLPEVKVQASKETSYKADTLSSPKFTEPLVDTPQTITVIKKEILLEQGATTLTEALRNTPGVGTFYVGENGNTSTGDTIYMRGFDSSSSIFVDGVRDLGSISRDIFNIEQVEVIKGPAGTDYGRSSPTGSINLASKMGKRGDSTSGTLAFGTEEQKRITFDMNRELGETAAIRLNLMGQESGVSGRDMVEANRWGIAPSLVFGLGTPTRVQLNYLHVTQNNIPDGGVSTIGLPGYSSPDPTRPQIGSAPAVDSHNFYGTVHDFDDVNADQFTAIVDHSFASGATLRNTSRWGRTHQDYMLTSFMASAANLKTPNINDPSTWTVARSNPTFKDQTNTILTNQTNVSMNLHTGAVEHDLSTGLELSRETSSTTGVAVKNGSTWPAANLYDPNSNVNGLQWGPNGALADGQTDTFAAYLFDVLKFGEKWQANAGLRLDHYKTTFDSTVACTASAANCGSKPVGTIVPGVVDGKKQDNLLSWKLGLVFKPAAAGSVYVNYATSAQPPAGSTMTLSSSANSLDNPIFEPQEAATIETGAKWEFFGGKLLVTGALYRTEIKNEVVQDPVDLQYYQTGKKEVKGIELGVVGQITPDWNVSAGFTTMDTEVKSGPAISRDGSRDLTYTPTTAFTSWTTYRLPFDLTIGGGVRYSGEMKRGTDGAIGTPDHTESYWVVDAMAAYPVTKNFTLQLNVYNLFDEDYVAAINKSGYRYTPGAPLSAMLTGIVNF